MMLLRKLGCLLLGHAPIVVRRGEDSVIACERCHRFLEVFVKGLYSGKQQQAQDVASRTDSLSARPGESQDRETRATERVKATESNGVPDQTLENKGRKAATR